MEDIKLFYSTNDFPIMKILEDSYKVIKEEIPEFKIDKITISRTKEEWGDKALKLIENLQTNREWIFSWQLVDKWFSFPLMFKNTPIGFAEEICPKTIEILKKLGNIKTAGFALLYPQSSLNIHTDNVGPHFNSMALNMKLTGDYSDLTIIHNNIEYKHIHDDGKLVIFNSELQHYASNHGLINRIILYIDFSTS